MVSLIVPFLVGVGAWMVWSFRRREALEIPLPVLRFDGDNSLERYRAETWTLLERGYKEYLKNGQAFKIRNIANKNRPIIILPLKYLAEVRIAPQDELSLPAHLDEVAIPKHVHGPSITEEVQQVARLDMNRALNGLVHPLQDACSLAMSTAMPNCSDFTPVVPYPVILQMFARMSARVMVGEDLAGDEWQSLSLAYMNAILGAPRVVKAKYHPWLYWTARYTCAAVKDVKKKRKACADFIAPTVEARQAAIDNQQTGDGNGPEDAIQWLIDDHRSKGKRATADDIIQNIFVTMVASIHSSAGTALSTLYDLLDHPDVLEEIRQEIITVRGEHLKETSGWTRHALGELRLLDSVMRESLRLHSFTEVTVQRLAVVDYRFKDGLRIPPGTQIAFTSRQYSRDADIYPDSDSYDPKRWLHKRQEIDWHGFHFPATSDDWINWGSGSHVCPGRFFADVTIKLIFIHLITTYNIKYPDGVYKRPQDVRDNFMVMPDMKTQLLFKTAY